MRGLVLHPGQLCSKAGSEFRVSSFEFRVSGSPVPPCERFFANYYLRTAARSSATISCDALIACVCWFTGNEIAPTRAWPPPP